MLFGLSFPTVWCVLAHIHQEDIVTGSPTVPSREQLALLAQTIRDVGRARRLSREDADDFAQSVQVRFLERHYDIIDRFAGRSSLRTYLTVVVNRMLLDWRNSLYGKWRPSAAAVGLGQHAVDLERLMARDGYSAAEATEILRMTEGAPPRQELERLAEQLPPRPRRRLVSDEALRDAEGPAFEDPIEDADRRAAQRHTRTALVAALRQLSAEDRWLLRARYVDDRSVQAVAQTLQTDPKGLYRRYDRVLRSLRGTLTTAGVPDLAAAYCVMRPARAPLLSRTGA